MPSAFEHGPSITVPASNTTAKAAVIWSAASNLGESTIILDSGGNGRIGLAGDLDLITLTSATVTVAGTVAATTLTGAGSGITALAAANITASGTLPALNGAALTALNGSNIASGTVAVARLGSGSPGSGNFLRGDGSWQTAGGIASVLADTTPQLGGNLDMQARLLVGNGGSTGIAISASGEVTMAAQPCVLAITTSEISNVTGDDASYTIVFDGEVFDQNADFASNTFTAPIGGKYLISVGIMISGTTAVAHQYIIVKMIASNRTVRAHHESYIAANIRDRHWINAVRIIDMDASDTVTIQLTVNSEASNVIDIEGNAASDVHNCVSIVKVA